MATIKDIAKLAEVSLMTVSRAFNSPEQVKEPVRERIYAIAKEINYVPNQVARSLVSNKTHIIQIITSIQPYEYYFTQLFAGIANQLSQKGYSIMISHDYQLNYQCDGIIIMGLNIGDDERIFRDVKTPTVLIGKTDMPVDWLDVDNVDGTFQVTEYLIKEGHTNISFLGIESKESFGQERYEGFMKAMRAYNLPVSEGNHFEAEHNIDGAREASKKILTKMKDDHSTALVCATDVMAFAIIEAAKQMGYEVPKDFSVVGFDGFLMHILADPKITTVSQPIYKMGMEVADVLIERINNPDMTLIRRIVKTELIVGGSVKHIKN